MYRETNHFVCGLTPPFCLVRYPVLCAKKLNVRLVKLWSFLSLDFGWLDPLIAWSDRQCSNLKLQSDYSILGLAEVKVVYNTNFLTNYSHTISCSLVFIKFINQFRTGMCWL